MTHVLLSSITINRESRQRRDIDDIDSLAESLSRLGQIQPIVITRDNVLVAGERRCAAASRLGWDQIEVKYLDEVDDLTLQAIELEENIKRKALIWQDECRAVANYHVLRGGALNGEASWSQDQTGEALGLTQSSIADRIAVARELIAGNEKVLAAPVFATAKGIVRRAEERRSASALEDLRDIVGAPKPVVPTADNIICADFLTWAPTYTGPRFNFLHCDFPYGINADKFNQGAADTHGGYDDSPDTYWRLLECLRTNMDRLVGDSAHIMFWLSMRYYDDTRKFLENECGFVTNYMPLVWNKSDGTGIIPDPERGPRQVYETALFGSIGDRKIVSPVANAISCPTDKSFHMSVKPTWVLSHFFRMFVDQHSRVLDPTCGSGSSIRAAESAKASFALGLEANAEFAEGAKQALLKQRVAQPKIEEV